MRRERRRNKRLPQRMYSNHGAYLFRPETGPAVRSGPAIGETLDKSATLVSKTWSARNFGDVTDLYRDEVLTVTLSALTRGDRTRQLDELRKVFGDLACDGITAQHCYQYYDTRRGLDGKPIPTTARRELSLLGHVFLKALRWGAASSNPARDLDLGPKHTQREQVLMTQVEALRSKDCNERMNLAIKLTVTLGQRQGDLLKMTPRVNKNRIGRL